MSKPGCAGLVLAVFLAGCASSARLDYDPSRSVIQFATEFQVKTSAHGLKHFIAKDNTIVTLDGVTTLKGWWCPIHREVRTTRDVNKRFDEVCRARGGSGVVSSLCRSSQSPQKVLFVVATSNHPISTDSICTNLFVAEPNVEPASATYRSILREYGYKTPEDMERDRLLAIEQASQARKQAQLAQAQREADLERMQEVGTRVCRDADGVRYTGFIEQATERKVKISIAFAEMIRNPTLRPGSFQPTIVWDYPENWKVCE